MRRISAPERAQKRHARAEQTRRRRNRPHSVEYFHQVDDGYSHLAAQLLAPLVERYDIELACHLAPPPDSTNAPEPDLLLDLSRYDAANIAPHYGLSFPERAGKPDAALVERANGMLASLDGKEFAQAAAEVGDALWSGSGDAVEALAERHPPADAATVAERLASGAARRKALGHYSGAMFHYGGEWYWGVDRLYHLENRLARCGARAAGAEMLAPRPAVETSAQRDDGSLTLRLYPSLRSPYTAVAFDAAVELARATGVRLEVRPVLPMVMRGVPATRAKGVYIFTDAAREAGARGVDWGGFYDPIGEPVRRAYSLYPWAARQGLGAEFLSAFLRAAFVEGVNTGRDAGLRHVVAAAGLDWREAQGIVGSPDWEDEIEANRLAMYECGLWGVPSFHLLDAKGDTLLRAWGQDRLWLVARGIKRAIEATPD